MTHDGTIELALERFTRSYMQADRQQDRQKVDAQFDAPVDAVDAVVRLTKHFDPGGTIAVIDIDGVQAFMVEGVCAALNAHFGSTYQPREIIDYNFAGWLPKEQGGWLNGVFEQAAFYGTLAPDYAAIAAMHSLHRQGVEVWVVTDRPEQTNLVTQAWLDHWLVPYDQLIVGRGMKRQVWEDVNANGGPEVVFIDDDATKAASLPPSTCSSLILLRRPWTPTIIPPPVIVADRWIDILDLFGVRPELLDVPQLSRPPALNVVNEVAA